MKKTFALRLLLTLAFSAGVCAQNAAPLKSVQDGSGIPRTRAYWSFTRMISGWHTR